MVHKEAENEEPGLFISANKVCEISLTTCEFHNCLPKLAFEVNMRRHCLVSVWLMTGNSSGKLLEPEVLLFTPVSTVRAIVCYTDTKVYYQ